MTFKMKSGFVAIIGRPNVGKSTILNAIIGAKVSIVTDKSQTTRDVIKGIYNDAESQIVFVDTPGIHKPIHELGKIMNSSALSSVKDVEAAILVIDASKHFGLGDQYILDNLRTKCPLFIAINKIDLATINQVIEIKKIYAEKYPNSQIIEMSAKKNFNTDELLKSIKRVLPDGPKYFPDEMISDKDDAFMMKEVIREELLNLLKQEVPHHSAVAIESFENKKEALVINAVIYIEKDSQKAIVIGHGGKMIKAIGTRARKELEQIYNKRVYLELFVKVKEDWFNNDRLLKELGYKNDH